MRGQFIPRSAFRTRRPERAGRPAWKCAEDFKRWLRKLPCAGCMHVWSDANPIIAAHVDHAGQGTRDSKGTGTKAADRHCIPLCNECHRRQHNHGWPRFEQSLPGKDAPALAARYWQEWPGRLAWERDLAASGEVA